MFNKAEKGVEENIRSANSKIKIRKMQAVIFMNDILHTLSLITNIIHKCRERRNKINLSCGVCFGDNIIVKSDFEVIKLN